MSSLFEFLVMVGLVCQKRPNEKSFYNFTYDFCQKVSMAIFYKKISLIFKRESSFSLKHCFANLKGIL